MAIGFFQLSLLNCEMKNYSESRKALERAFECLRENEEIDYRPLNLKIVLNESDITFNLALVSLALQDFVSFKKYVESALETVQE